MTDSLQAGNPSSVSLSMRETLFGDIPQANFLPSKPSSLSVEPWKSFFQAKELGDAGDKSGESGTLRQIAEMPGLESRVYLQAWHFLRELGHKPPAEKEKEVLGVVVEAAMPKGLDIVAAYADHRARYYNFSGAAIIWECPDNTLDTEIDAVLKAASIAAQSCGPWEGARPPAPVGDHVRLSFLTPSGIHFGEAPMNAMGREKIGGPVLYAAIALMQRLIAHAKKHK
ncbi:MAG TPA: hypothetical protein VG893_04095 [Terracidiphilus sp.]|nr:hypothetical protein [Terracidiphilus sp.]